MQFKACMFGLCKPSLVLKHLLNQDLLEEVVARPGAEFRSKKRTHAQSADDGVRCCEVVCLPGLKNLLKVLPSTFST